MENQPECNYEKDLSIDPDSLEADLLDQSIRYFRYSELYAQSVLDRDRAKDNFSQIQAQLDSEVRNDPAKHGVQKVTENAIKAAILLSSKYADANEKMLQANLVTMTLQGAVTAFDHRKRMLEKITDLKISGLYSDPVIRKEVREITADKMTDLQNDKLNEGLAQHKRPAGPIRRVSRED